MFNMVIWAIVFVESSGNPKVVSSANAKGLMQVTSIGAAQVEQVYNWDCGDLFEPIHNLMCGKLLFSHYLESENHSLRAALVKYNGGGRAVRRWRAGKPYRESRNYLRKVCGLVNCDIVLESHLDTHTWINQKNPFRRIP